MKKDACSKVDLAVRICGTVTALIGSFWLAAWFGGWAAQWSAAGAITVKANMALGQLLGGLALLFLRQSALTLPRRAVGSALAIAMLLVGVLTLSEHLFRYDVGIDQLLATEAPGAAATMSPNRMGPLGSTSLALLGAGLLAIALGARVFAPLFGLATCLINLVPAIGFLYRIEEFYGRAHITGIAWPTVVALTLLGTALILVNTESGPIGLLLRSDAGGALMRRMLLPVIMVPLILGFVRTYGQLHGFYGSAVGTGMLVITLTLLFGILLWRTSVHLSRSADSEAKATESVRESEERLRMQQQRMPIGCILVDEHNCFSQVNPAAQAIFGYTEEELRGRHVNVLVPEVVRPHLDELMHRLAEGDMTANGVNENLSKDGRTILCQWTNTPLRDAADRHIGFLSMVQDITEQRKSEEALRESEQFYRQTLESIPGMVFTTRSDGYCDFQSQQWVDFTGVPMSEHLGDGWTRLLHPEDRPRAYAAWLAAVEERASYDLEYRVRRYDGQYEWFKVRGVPIRDAAGRIARWFGAATNIEVMKRSEEALKAALQEKEVLLKEIHHRVKNNMQVISSLVDLQAGQLQDEAVRAVLQDVTHRVRSMALVHEKLYQSTDMARIDFAEYLQSLLGYLWRAHGDAASGIRLVFDLNPVALPVNTAVPCGLIMNELATNALKHAFRGRNGGEVRVSLQAGEQVCINIRDNGTGLPAELDWRQAKSLGLRLVQILARQLSAAVEFSSNNGTEISISLRE